MDREKWLKVARGAAIAGIGAVLTVLTEASGAVDLGVWAPLVGGVLAVATNALRLWAKND